MLMKIMAVDNYRQRLEVFEKLLLNIFPEDEIVTFFDPFRAAQYASRSNVDILFVDMNLQPFSGTDLAGLICKFSEHAEVYYISDTSDEIRGSSTLVRPVTKEAVQKIIRKND